MTLFFFLTVIQAIVAAGLVLVVLLQRSEGGGLGIGGGGSPGGLMSARGAADFLTRTTKWLAVLFVGISIVLAGLAVNVTSGRDIDDSLDRSVSSGSLSEQVTGQAADDAATPASAAPAEEPAADDPLADVAN